MRAANPIPHKRVRPARMAAIPCEPRRLVRSAVDVPGAAPPAPALVALVLAALPPPRAAPPRGPEPPTSSPAAPSPSPSPAPSASSSGATTSSTWSSSCRRTARSITTSARSPEPTASRCGTAGPRSASPTRSSGLRAAVPRPEHSRRADRTRSPIRRRRGRREDGRVRADDRRRPEQLRRPPDAPRCRDDLGPQGQPDVMGYHNATRDPELWAYAKHVRPAGPHVRAGRLVDAALAPVPRVGLGGELRRPARPDELSSRPGVVDRQQRHEDIPIYAWTDHLPALRGRGLVGLLRRRRHVSATRARAATAKTHRPQQNPLPSFTTTSRTSSGTSVHAEVRRGSRTARSPRCRG